MRYINVLTETKIFLTSFLCSLSLILTFIGVLGLIYNTNNFLRTIINIELILLSLTLHIIILAKFFADIQLQSFALFILGIAAAESAIGLSILIENYRICNHIEQKKLSNLRH